MTKHTVIQLFDTDRLEVGQPRLYPYPVEDYNEQFDWLAELKPANLLYAQFTVYNMYTDGSEVSSRDTWRYSNLSWNKESVMPAEPKPLVATPGRHRVGYGPAAGGRFINERMLGEQHFSVFDASGGCLAHVFNEGDAVLYAHSPDMYKLLVELANEALAHTRGEPVDWSKASDLVLALVNKLPVVR